MSTSVRSALWRDSPASFDGVTVNFHDTYSYPKPANKYIPILIGGESDAALRRVARFGDGWIALDLDLEDASRRIDLLRRLVEGEGRSMDALRIIKTIFSWTTVDEMKRYRDAGDRVQFCHGW
jgi:alkanesulfonate monooxygenase SsuD/methylene tetrahydromethanopterin reductase-like flavin-dependent oxidoreductase (luciferase family)